MTPVPDPAGTLAIGCHRLEYRLWGSPPDAAPTLVLLHEGLGCVGRWGDFPQQLAALTGAGVFAYSRAGYGGSSPATLPRPKRYMHDEALQVLPELLDRIGLRRGVLVGHSDGGSIAAIHAGSVPDARVLGLSLMAPHFIVEDVTIAGIVAAKRAWDTGGLRPRLARWHRDADATFRGWNDAWLTPEFRDWNITGCLPGIRVPMQIIQGADDQYGTPRQFDIAQRTCSGPVETVRLPGIGHAPHREAPEATLGAVAEFVGRILRQ